MVGGRCRGDAGAGRGVQAHRQLAVAMTVEVCVKAAIRAPDTLDDCECSRSVLLFSSHLIRMFALPFPRLIRPTTLAVSLI